MSNYPVGSMRGSGIYSYDVSENVWCEECETDQDVDMDVNDWGDAEWTCPACGHVEEFNVAERAAEIAAEAAADAYRDEW